MNVLALDTSHRTGSISLRKADGSVLTGKFGPAEMHLKEIGRVTQEILAEASMSLRGIDLLALVKGPGSFTGLRIGMAFAKGIHASLGVRIVTMDTLELLATPLSAPGVVVAPMIDAKRNEVYAAAFIASEDDGSGMRRVVEPLAVEPGKFLDVLERSLPAGTRKTVFVGSGAAKYGEMLAALPGDRFETAPEISHEPSTEALASSAPALEPLPDEEIPALEPFYIRASDAELKRLREVRADG
jgi:tRNA threonylcarbamoyladenosine biosynthesis protein TsaB